LRFKARQVIVNRLSSAAGIIVGGVALRASCTLGQAHEVVIGMLDFVTRVTGCAALGKGLFMNTLIEELRLQNVTGRANIRD
jgi:hypothetical protein